MEKLKRIYDSNKSFKKIIDKGYLVLFSISASCMALTAGLVWFV